jgi:SAM-dependent methyltransferase
VASAVAAGTLGSGRYHFLHWGKTERRMLKVGRETLIQQKRQKLEKIRPLLDPSIPRVETQTHFNFLTEALEREFRIVDTTNVSSNPYGPSVTDIFRRHCDGLVLDVGAGKRLSCFSNVVNYEIVAYDSTDVLGVGEVLPFVDESFDAIVSISVLEHVKDPWRCAREMIRVLKKGGELFVEAPFNTPLHGYPHHYYNMTHQGLRNLFDHALLIEKQDVLDSALPIWNLTWYLGSWAAGLEGATREEFLQMKVGDLIGEPVTYLSKGIVRELSRDKNFELAACTALWARKLT